MNDFKYFCCASGRKIVKKTDPYNRLVKNVEMYADGKDIDDSAGIKPVIRMERILYITGGIVVLAGALILVKKLFK